MRKKEIKAWIRIIEAFLGILIVMGVVLAILSKQNLNFNDSENIYEKQRQILEIIGKNETLRGQVLSENYNAIDSFIVDAFPSSFNFSTRICILDDICNSGETPNDKDIYATEIVITSTLNQYSPKKLRFFAWKK